jgi:hypothetical protein
MRTFDIWDWFFLPVRLKPRSPLWHRFAVYEIDGECRSAEAGFLRIWPFRVAIGFGRWKLTGMTQAEMRQHFFAESVREMDLNDANGELDSRFAQAARQQVAAHATDPDDEWTILEMTGLDQ